MNKLKSIGIFLIMLLSSLVVYAQDAAFDEVRKEQRMQQSIYIVLAVVVTIVIGLFIYLFTLDRKISKLEK
ncbi:MAG: CcmD family protein [Chitinophagaceae bacterium]|nr:CcmD family protein [Chitinophagaceae bacterium]MCW5905591.1 CcmD family protein [Chitinophagaceae bacterium]